MMLRRGVIASAGASAAPGSRNIIARTVDRILRYPDGSSRRICYPAPSAEEEAPEVATTTWESSSLWWTEPAPQVAEAQPSNQEDAIQTFDWSNLREQAAKVKHQAELVAGSFQVLHGCPWVAPRPMYALTVSLTSIDSSLKFYTLRTRTAKGLDVMDELSRVLGNASLASAMSLTDMQDGVVTFSSREHAERFAASMIESADQTYNDVHICEVPSHELFRVVVGEARACVVAVGFPGLAPEGGQGGADGADGTWLPTPAQLAHSLRGPSAWEEHWA